ncbi:MAG: HDOD domain-containing protein, partial [Gammaproteobacteria bacterium]|nr:HDOD domain-containing protein [Gammaproteobacteria bacterium]
NSPFYGFPSQINTISRAITIIGTRELRDLVLATLVVRTFNGLDNELISMEQFWRHSVTCAVVARVLAGHLHESNTERFFVVGLLHDIGSLIIYRKIPELAREALLRSEHGDIALYQAERDVILITLTLAAS